MDRDTHTICSIIISHRSPAKLSTVYKFHIRLYNCSSNPTAYLRGAKTSTMVRVKERYLLVNIVYPEGSRALATSDLPDVLVYNQPTTDAFNSRGFTYAIKSEITNLFGDYGAGAVGRALRGP